MYTLISCLLLLLSLRVYLVLLLILLLLTVGAPAQAQRDTLKMGEALSANVVKKQQAKALTPAKGPETMRIREALELETKRKGEVKK